MIATTISSSISDTPRGVADMGIVLPPALALLYCSTPPLSSLVRSPLHCLQSLQQHLTFFLQTQLLFLIGLRRRRSHSSLPPVVIQVRPKADRHKRKQHDGVHRDPDGSWPVPNIKRP